MTGYRSSPAASEGMQQNFSLGADPWFNDLPEGVDDDDDWGLDGAVGGESVSRARMKRKSPDLREACRKKKDKKFRLLSPRGSN